MSNLSVLLLEFRKIMAVTRCHFIFSFVSVLALLELFEALQMVQTHSEKATYAAFICVRRQSLNTRLLNTVPCSSHAAVIEAFHISLEEQIPFCSKELSPGYSQEMNSVLSLSKHHCALSLSPLISFYSSWCFLCTDIFGFQFRLVSV